MKKTVVKMIMLCFTALLMVSMPLLAEDVDEDELFGGSSSEEEGLFETGGSDDDLFSGSDDLLTEYEPSEGEMDEDLLAGGQPVVIGGSFSFSATPGWGWKFDQEDSVAGVETSLQTKLFFDARPENSVRVFGKASASHPFSGSGDFSVMELFSDFTVGDYFIRVGKQTMNWGVGRFFQPANLINDEKVDPSNLDRELGGTAAVRVNKPMGADNLYGYVVLPSDKTVDFADITYAAKYEKVVGNSELGFGATYSYNDNPAAMTTISSSIGDVSLFAEGVATYDTTGEDLDFSATAGASYLWEADTSDLSIMTLGQYGYNITIFSPVKHAGGAVVSATFTDKVSAGINWLGRFDTGTNIGMVNPTVTWKPADYLSLQAGIVYAYGGLSTFLGQPVPKNTLGGTFRVSLGGTSF
ncbi:MAG: hypothetical protein ACQEQU_07280 [Spirochaetota bacterium]